jgi:hypothetical protein
MKRNRREVWRATIALLVLTCNSPVPGAQAKQGNEQLATQLIGRLTQPAVQKLDPVRATGFTCGSLESDRQEYRALAASLSRLGKSAVPDIETALDSIANRGQASEFAPGAGWLMYAYARIEGRDAYDRLSRMIGKPELKQLQNTLAASVALSLDLTSYVDSYTVSTGVLCKPPQPRDTLDRLVLAWETNDRRSLESTLAPAAKAAFQRMPNARALVARATGAKGSIAIGYRFRIPGAGSEPPETLEERAAPDSATGDSARLAIDTHFVDAKGRDCGMYVVSFRRAAYSSPADAYPIDNADLPGLIRLMASCASQ